MRPTIKVNDIVRLKNTNREYTVVDLYDHFMGLEGGKETYEAWAKLKTSDNKDAHWKVQQLEKKET